MTFALAEGVADPKQLALRAHRLPDTFLCRTAIIVVFEDGLQWRHGDYYKPDPERPGESLVMDEDYFPGSLTGT